MANGSSKPGVCSHLNIQDRISLMWMSNETITYEKLAYELLNLPPTSSASFQSLLRSCHFNVLYLITYKTRSDIFSHLLNLGDTIFLSYFQKTGGDLFFPNAEFAHCRMALYLAARLLEINQGWMYNYYVFLDDDVVFQSGSIHGNRIAKAND